METIKLSTGIKRIAITNEEDVTVAVLTIDTNDTHLLNRFLGLYDGAQKINEECKSTYKSLGLDEKDGITTDDAKNILSVNEKAVNDLIGEIEKMFGKGLIHDIFKENYDLNPKFVPDISLLQSFFEQIMPLLDGLIQKKAKYTPYSR